jgi:hypothetical protein
MIDADAIDAADAGAEIDHGGGDVTARQPKHVIDSVPPAMPVVLPALVPAPTLATSPPTFAAISAPQRNLTPLLVVGVSAGIALGILVSRLF